MARGAVADEGTASLVGVPVTVAFSLRETQLCVTLAGEDAERFDVRSASGVALLGRLTPGHSSR